MSMKPPPAAALLRLQRGPRRDGLGLMVGVTIGRGGGVGRGGSSGHDGSLLESGGIHAECCCPVAGMMSMRERGCQRLGRKRLGSGCSHHDLC